MRRSRSLQSRYVDAQGGWRYLFFSLAIAGILGLSFRLYFSPDRVKHWVSDVIKSQKGPEAIAFDGAQFRLSKGAVPSLAIVVTGLRVAPAPQCHPEPSLTIGELTLPFRFLTLFTGRVAVGTVSAAGVVVDLDGFTDRCEKAETASPPQAAPPIAVSLKGQSLVNRSAERPSDTEVKPWWTERQLQDVKSFVDGVEFQQVEVQFENRTKRVYLDSFSAELSGSALNDREQVSLRTELRFPPEIVYGEKIPPLVIEAKARADHAEVSILAHLSEGRLNASMEMSPGPQGNPKVELRATVENAPLSTLVPLLTKSGIVDNSFEPRFLWLDCSTKIKGSFQGLFNNHPLQVENCNIEGENTKVEILSATRKPDGTWEPFRVHFAKLDLNKLMQTLGVRGPEGISSDFGRLTGDLDLRGPESALFNGGVEGTRFFFSRRNLRAEQRMSRLGLHIELLNGRFKGGTDEVTIDNGEFSGSMSFDLERHLKDGSIVVQIQNLVFDPRVQSLLMDGLIGPLSGSSESHIVGGRLKSLEADLKIGSSQGRDWKFESAEIHSSLQDSGHVAMTLKSPQIEINHQSLMFTSATPLFFNHQFQEEWLAAKNFSAEARIPDGGGIRWNKARAAIENGRVLLSSEGAMSRENELFGWVEVDYPKAKHLRWSLTGSIEAAKLSETSSTLKELKKRVDIDDAALGL